MTDQCITQYKLNVAYKIIFLKDHELKLVNYLSDDHVLNLSQ